jgi:uncharacterized protein
VSVPAPDPTGAGREPQHHVRLPALGQTWSAVSFVHWRVGAGQLAPLLPEGLGLEVAEQDGSAWVSLVLFCASDTRPGPLPTPPLLPPFAETNLRTYVRTADGREAIWFLSLEASSAVTSAGGSAVYGVPYHLADASVEVRPDSIVYRSKRTTDDVGHDIEVRTGAWYTPDERRPLDEWLTGRWRAVSSNAGVLLETFVEHEPWPLRHGRIGSLAENVLASVGLAPTSPPALVHVADEVHVRLGLPSPLGGG